MTDKFTWGYNKHDFSPIEETLKTYFPIDNPSQYNEENIKSFPGLKKIEDILNDNFYIQKNYRERWSKFRKFLKQEFKKPVMESMVAFYPCYSGTVILKKEKNESLNYIKELHFYISLLGPYYTIFAIDKSEIMLEEFYPELIDKEKKLKRNYPAYHAITVSPYLEYEGPFKSLQNKIIQYFPDLRFIPFQTGLKKVSGISLLYPDSEGEVKDSVFSALFRPDPIINAERRGDEYFGFDEWLKVKKLAKERMEKIREGLLKKSLANNSQTTLQKVWKLKTVNHLSTTFVGGGLAFGMSLFEVLDLSEDNMVTIISKEDEEPYSTTYLIKNNEIHIDDFNNEISLRISTMSINELRLILNMNVAIDENKKIQGDIIEMVFEPYN